MEVLHTLLTPSDNGPVERFEGSVKDFLHFNHPGAPLDRMALVYATNKERKELEVAGVHFDNDCVRCSLASSRCTAGCARLEE